MKDSLFKLWSGNRSGYQNRVQEPDTLSDDSDDNDANTSQSVKTKLSKLNLDRLNSSPSNKDSHEIRTEKSSNQTVESQMLVSEQLKNSKSGPFSQIIESMLPPEVTPIDYDRYDAFGFHESVARSDSQFTHSPSGSSCSTSSSSSCSSTRFAWMNKQSTFDKTIDHPSDSMISFDQIVSKPIDHDSKSSQLSPSLWRSSSIQESEQITATKLPSTDIDESQINTRWLTYLQMHYNQDCELQFTWNQIEMRIRRTTALDELIQQFGLPSSLRSKLWMRLGDSEAFKCSSRWTYDQLCVASKQMPPLPKRRIVGVLPNNVCFRRPDSIGVQRLRDLLGVMRWLQRDQLTIGWLNEHLVAPAKPKRSRVKPKVDNFLPTNYDEHTDDVGEEGENDDDDNVANDTKEENENGAKHRRSNVTGLNVDQNLCKEIDQRWQVELNVPLIAAHLLLISEPIDAFWLLLSIVNETESYCNTIDLNERAKPAGDTSSMLARVIQGHCPSISRHLQTLEVDVWLICHQWIDCLFAGWLRSTRLLYRLWDLHFYYGVVVHYQLLIGLLIQNERDMLTTSNTTQAIRSLGRLPELIVNEESLIKCWRIGRQRLLALPRSIDGNLEIKFIEATNTGCANDMLSLLDSMLIRQWNENPCAGQALKTALRSARLRNGTTVAGFTGSTSAVSRARPDQLKVKNVRQTTILMELQETIEAIVRHFIVQHPHLRIDLTLRDDSANSPTFVPTSVRPSSSSPSLRHSDTNNNSVDASKEEHGVGTCPPSNESILLRQMLCTFSRKVDQFGASQIRLNAITATESIEALESISRPTETINANLGCQSKAIALIAFKSEQPDELHFRAGQIVRILDDRDEHCWIGQIGDRIGWFPAKFVRTLDETGGEYLTAGDDSVDVGIRNLVRGRLGAVIKCVLTHGLRKGLGLFTVHPWMLIEEVAERLRAQQLPTSRSKTTPSYDRNRSMQSLSQTYRLHDTTCTVEEPEVAFVRAVEQINRSHVNIPMDVRLRSWICLALNRQQLPHWFAFYCECDTILMSKHYHQWSYITSPAFKLIKSHLRILNQLSFHLDACAELVAEPQLKSPVSKNGVQDMLVKHHLFSWDI